MNVEEMLRQVIYKLNEDWKIIKLYDFDRNINLFETLDSLSLLSIVIETESAIENEIGRYVALSDENLMTNGVSPFCSFVNWVQFIEIKIQKNG